MASKINGYLVKRWRQKHSLFSYLAVAERSANRIQGLFNDDNTWIEDSSVIKQMAVEYFKALYRSDQAVSQYQTTPGFIKLTPTMVDDLNIPMA